MINPCNIAYSVYLLLQRAVNGHPAASGSLLQGAAQCRQREICAHCQIQVSGVIRGGRLLPRQIEYNIQHALLR